MRMILTKCWQTFRIRMNDNLKLVNRIRSLMKIQIQMSDI